VPDKLEIEMLRKNETLNFFLFLVLDITAIEINAVTLADIFVDINSLQSSSLSS
jgi:hypothetical protein